jgi:hypothetical protein
MGRRRCEEGEHGGDGCHPQALRTQEARSATGSPNEERGANGATMQGQREQSAWGMTTRRMNDSEARMTREDDRRRH